MTVFAYTGRNQDNAQIVYRRLMTLWMSESSFSVKAEALSSFLSRIVPLQSFVEISRLLLPLEEEEHPVGGSPHFGKLYDELNRRGWMRLGPVQVWVTLARIEAAVSVWRSANDFANDFSKALSRLENERPPELERLLQACEYVADEALVLAEFLIQDDHPAPSLVVPVMDALDDLIHEVDGLWGPEVLDDVSLVAKSMRHSFEAFLVQPRPSAHPAVESAKYIDYMPLENPDIEALRVSWAATAPLDLVVIYALIREARTLSCECIADLAAKIGANEAASAFGPSWNCFGKQMSLHLYDAGEIIFQLGQELAGNSKRLSKLKHESQFKLLSRAFALSTNANMWLVSVEVCPDAQRLIHQIVDEIISMFKANKKEMVLVMPPINDLAAVTALGQSRIMAGL